MVKKYSLSNMPKSIKEKLPSFRDKVRFSLENDKENFDYFSFMKRFIFDTTLDDKMRDKLRMTRRPPLEVNELEQFINTQLGEWRNFEPSVEITPSSTITDKGYLERQYKTCEIVEGYVRWLLSPGENTFNGFELMQDILGGGLSAAQVKIDYNSDDPHDHDMRIFVEKKAYPTMCGWDPHAVKGDRSDGRYCYEIAAYTKDEVEEIFGEDILKNLKPSNSLEGFDWSYSYNGQEYYLFCEFYERTTKKVHTVLLSDGRSIKKSDYLKELNNWDKPFEVPPVIVGEKKDGKEVTIWQYTFHESDVIYACETIYKYLPIGRAQGGNVRLEGIDGRGKKDKIRSYVHNLVGLQVLKNTAAQSLAFRLENMISHNLMMEKSTIIPDQTQALINNQIPNVIIWNARPQMQDGSVEQSPPPMIIQPPPVPEVIPMTMSNTSMDMRRALGVLENNSVPGGNIASNTLQMAYSQETRVSYPWKKAYEDILNWIGMQLVDLIPKVFKTPTTIPIITRDGKREFAQLNYVDNPDSVFMNFNPKDFNIKIVAGANAEILKQIGMNQMMEMSRTYPSFMKFIDQECLPQLVENLDIKNKGSWVIKSQEWVEEQKKMQMMQSQNAPMDPVKAQMQIEQAKIAQKQQEMQVNAAVQGERVKLDNRKVDMELIKTLSSVNTDKANQMIAKQKANSENVRSAVDLATKLAAHKSDVRQYHHQAAREDMKHVMGMINKSKDIDDEEDINDEM